MNTRLLAEALRAFANALETPPDAQPGEAAPPPPAAPAAAATPAKRGRGRPVAGEAPAAPAASPAPAAPAPAAPAAELAATLADPFEPTPAAPTATLEEVRAALKGLREATTQDAALKILKDVGKAANLSDLQPALYGAVVRAAKAAVPPPAPVEADPFGDTPAPVAAAAPAQTVVEKLPDLTEVKAEVVAAQKRTSTEKVQALLMEHGGKAPTRLPDGSAGPVGPSLKALPEANYVAFVKALKSLPDTKAG